VLLLLLTLAVSTANLVTATPAFAAFRDIAIHFTNNSDSALTRASETLDGGCWTTEPPDKIAIGQSVDIHSESCGVFTGTEFHVSYTLDRTGTTMSMHYSNPAVGEDTFEETAPRATSSRRTE